MRARVCMYVRVEILFCLLNLERVVLHYTIHEKKLNVFLLRKHGELLLLYILLTICVWPMYL